MARPPAGRSGCSLLGQQLAGGCKQQAELLSEQLQLHRPKPDSVKLDGQLRLTLMRHCATTSGALASSTTQLATVMILNAASATRNVHEGVARPASCERRAETPRHRHGAQCRAVRRTGWYSGRSPRARRLWARVWHCS